MGDKNWPERFSGPNGDLELDDEVESAIAVRPVEDSTDAYEHRVIHEPTGIFEEYTVAGFARGMNPNDLRETARRQLVRDHPEILVFHVPELRRRKESMGL